MAYILAIETSTTNCSVALSNNDKVIAFMEFNDVNYSHSELLHDYILKVLLQAEINIKELSAIAVSKGPGSYTGLRIGVSTAKGLCYSLNIPLIAIDTLESLARQLDVKDAYIVPMLDARRMEVYSAVYNQNFCSIENVSAHIITPDSFLNLLGEKPVYFLGNAVEKTAKVIFHENAHFVYDKLPSAVQMIVLALYQYKIGDFENVAYFEPFYLKDFMVSSPKS